MMQLLLSVSALVDLPSLPDLHFVLAGHGYDTGASPRPEPRGDVDDGGDGIGTASIIAVLLLAAATVGLLAWLSPSSSSAKFKALAPAALPVVIIAAPLVFWAVSAGGGEKSLIVERATGVTGARELLVSLGDDDLNTLETTDGRRVVRVECLGRDGQVVLDAQQRWPFIDEEGYEYAHAHVAASPEQVQRADRCRLRGTRVRLEADVSGPLTD